MKIEKIDYKGWPNSYRLSNAEIELVVLSDVGPRIIRLGFLGEQNLFAEYVEFAGQTGGDAWCVYGGHRFWHAPEEMPRTYYPDNAPVKIEQHEGVFRTIQPIETTTHLQKELDISLDADQNRVTVTHRLRNCGMWAVEVSPWALSVMAVGGTGILPLPPRAKHGDTLLPSNPIIIWPYTDMSEHRITMGQRHILVHQDVNTDGKQPQKIGLPNTEGWQAYANDGYLFVKLTEHVDGAIYPDMGCSAEMFTDPTMLEVESLGPLAKLEPGATVEHNETWHIFKKIGSVKTEEDVDQIVLPIVKTCL